MGRPNIPVYGNADVGSAIEDVEKIINKIKTNKFDNADLLNLYKANGELIEALLDHDYED